MNPRLKTSKKWVSFPKEYTEQITEAVKQGFSEQTKDMEIIVEGQIFAEEILIRLGLLSKGSLRQNNFEASLNYKANKDNVVECIYTGIDALGSMIEHFLTTGEDDFPRSWEEFQYENRVIFLQYSTDNTKLENEADRILGTYNDSLVKEDSDEDALAFAEIVDDPETLKESAQNKSAAPCQCHEDDCDCDSNSESECECGCDCEHEADDDKKFH